MRRIVADVVRGTLARQSDPEEHVHELRTSIKRVRAYLRLLEDGIGESWYRRADTDLKEAARGLATTRDRTVIWRTIDQMIAGARDAASKDALETFRLAMEWASAAENGDAAVRAIGTAEHALAETAGSFAVQAVHAEQGSVLEAGLKRTYKRARRSMGRWLKSGAVEHAHGWRKYAKYLMFQVHFLRTAWPRRLGPLGKRLSAIEASLGAANDLAILEKFLAEDGSVREIGEDYMRCALDAIARRRRALIRRAEKRGGKVFEDRPGRFARAVTGKWRRWTRATTTTAPGLDV